MKKIISFLVYLALRFIILSLLGSTITIGYWAYSMTHIFKSTAQAAQLTRRSIAQFSAPAKPSTRSPSGSSEARPADNVNLMHEMSKIDLQYKKEVADFQKIKFQSLAELLEKSVLLRNEILTSGAQPKFSKDLLDQLESFRQTTAGTFIAEKITDFQVDLANPADPDGGLAVAPVFQKK
jgi:hypothetical protein